MKVREIMTSAVECIDPNETVEGAAKKMKSFDVGTVPVCENDRLVGILTDRDITIRATAEGKNPRETKVRDVMSPDVVYCFEDQDEEDAAELMRTHQIRRLLVMNKSKRLVGILSLGDLATEITDEHRTATVLREISQPSHTHH